MDNENEQAMGKTPEPTPSAPPAPVRRFQDFEFEQRRTPLVYASFFLWTPLFFFVIALLAYFFFPDALNDAIAIGYKEYNQFMPAPATVMPAPKPVAAAVTPAPAPAPEPAQTYSVQEIKEGVQDHLVDAGVTEKDSTYDWKRLEYTDPTDLMYELYAHSTQGKVQLCMGKIALDLHEHRMFVTSQLVGW